MAAISPGVAILLLATLSLLHRGIRVSFVFPDHIPMFIGISRSAACILKWYQSFLVTLAHGLQDSQSQPGSFQRVGNQNCQVTLSSDESFSTRIFFRLVGWFPAHGIVEKKSNSILFQIQYCVTDLFIVSRRRWQR